ncbi:AAA family ATPase [Aquimarina algicola]|uniref:VWA domain-containing protein n=1 Tax=Aquimarina algicola TaxID=2589995 RepID=A0A504J8W2_9FLAO|nr:AAA family ATPase [Aquimarina algicola]TPN87034.1 VWA domain-containing protein [Aquimarina algicola]
MIQDKKQINFPFSAIVGQDDFKLALILNLVDPRIGGVLAIGDKGTGKTTLIRSVTSLMSDHQNYPFVNLPIGVSEDRLIGNVSLEQLINEKKEVVNLGLMAQAHQGILYVDEVNLLQDYLTDILLDAAASGSYYVEREGISQHFNSQFCLVGSMNPEEGNLRPQLRDRFGLSVNIVTPVDPVIRQKIIKQRFKFDDNPADFVANYKSKDESIAKQIDAAKNNLKSIKIDDSIIEYCSKLAIQHQVEGLRADILLLKTARAYIAYQDKSEITKEAVDKIADFVLNHRSLQHNPNQRNPSQNQKEQSKESPADGTTSKEEKINMLPPQNEFNKPKEVTANTTDNGVNSIKNNKGNVTSPDIKNTVSQYVATDKFELKTKRKNNLLKQHHIFLIDSSGSMLKDEIIAYAKGTVHKIAEQSKKQNTQFSMVSLFDGEAQQILRQTKILKEIEEALAELKTGGKTNLIAGFKEVKSIASDTDICNNLHIITDGKLNTEHTLEDIVLAFQTYCKGIHITQIIDAEKGMVKIGVAQEFANRIQATYEILIREKVSEIPTHTKG